MEFYLNPERLEQRNENVREQLRHVRRFSELVRQSKKIDTMHQKELIRIQQPSFGELVNSLRRVRQIQLYR